MDVKEAARAAKQHIIELFGEEGINFVGLEEIKLDYDSDNWFITVGFNREWEQVKSPLGHPIMTRAEGRAYKVVCIDDKDGKILSVEDRILPAPN